MEVVRTFKANLKLEGKPCGWCQIAFKLGDDAAVCAACEKEHHGRCWESKGGCSTAGCANTPLTRLDTGAAGASALPIAAMLAPGMMTCPNCRSTITAGSMVCPLCTAITSPDGLYHGPKMNAPGAVSSLVFGIVGLLICGVIFGPIAIAQSNSAKKAMASNPTLGGGGLATAGLVLGIIDLVGWAIIMMLKMSH